MARFLESERGAAAAEHALLLAVLAGTIAAAALVMGEKIGLGMRSTGDQMVTTAAGASDS